MMLLEAAHSCRHVYFGAGTKRKKIRVVIRNAVGFLFKEVCAFNPNRFFLNE